MSDTPRTDSEIRIASANNPNPFVPAYFCRQLERELAAVTKERDDLINAGGPAFIRSEAIRNLKNDLAGATAQLAAAKEDADRLDYLLTCEPDESRRILSLQPFYAKQDIDAALAAHRKQP